MLRVFALKLLLDLRILIAPEAGQVLSDLDRPMIRSEDMDQDRNPAHGNCGSGFHAKQFLDSYRNVRRVRAVIDHLWSAAI